MSFRSIIFLWIFILLPACTPNQSVSSLPTNPAKNLTPTHILVTPTGETIKNNMVNEALSQEPIVSPTAVPTNQSSKDEVAICSPLLLHPLDELPGIISAPYKPPPKGHEEERHHGVDFGYWHFEDRDSMLSEKVQSILPGKVAASIDDKYHYGNMVIIETEIEDLPEDLIHILPEAQGKSLYVLYSHLNNPPSVNLGDQVESCQSLGEVGKSGNTDIPHLHLETRIGPPNTVIKSMRFYDTRATLEEMDAYTRWRTSGEFSHFDPMIILSFRTE